MEITVLYLHFTASIGDLMVANIRLLAPLAQFATIKSPIDAVKFSNAIQLSPISHDCKEKRYMMIHRIVECIIYHIHNIIKTNVRENRRDNQEWTIQRHRTQNEDKQNNSKTLK